MSLLECQVCRKSQTTLDTEAAKVFVERHAETDLHEEIRHIRSRKESSDRTGLLARARQAGIDQPINDEAHPLILNEGEDPDVARGTFPAEVPDDQEADGPAAKVTPAK